MFDEILQMVKEHLSNTPEVAALPQDQQDALHNEIATHVANGLNNQAAAPQGNSGGGILGLIENSMSSGGTITSAIEGGLIGSLTSKFGLPPSITGAISGALPGLLQKLTSKKS